MVILPAKLGKENVIKVYTQSAPLYDLWGKLTETKARRKALELARISNGESILEVAVGTGVNFVEIVKANPDGENFGIDLTQAMLAKARSKVDKLGLKNCVLSRGDAYSLDFPENRFDLLFNSYMFDLLPEEDFPVVLKEFRRVLKPDGRLVIVSMTKGERFYQHLWELIYRLNPKWLGGCRGVVLYEALQVAGFKISSHKKLSQCGFPSEIVSAAC